MLVSGIVFVNLCLDLRDKLWLYAKYTGLSLHSYARFYLFRCAKVNWGELIVHEIQGEILLSCIKNLIEFSRQS